MSVLIKNIEMPKNCSDCDFESYPRGAHYCQLEMRAIESLDRPEWCPLEAAEPRWVPCSERLPEPYSGEYLVTINDGAVYTDVLWFDSPGDGRYKSCFYKTDDDGYGVVCDDVIAWMPLPKPYVEVEE